MPFYYLKVTKMKADYVEEYQDRLFEKAEKVVQAKRLVNKSYVHDMRLTTA